MNRKLQNLLLSLGLPLLTGGLGLGFTYNLSQRERAEADRDAYARIVWAEHVERMKCVDFNNVSWGKLGDGFAAEPIELRLEHDEKVSWFNLVREWGHR